MKDTVSYSIDYFLDNGDERTIDIYVQYHYEAASRYYPGHEEVDILEINNIPEEYDKDDLWNPVQDKLNDEADDVGDNIYDDYETNKAMDKYPELV